jgi:quinoprotein glucose dehydrogenase
MPRQMSIIPDFLLAQKRPLIVFVVSFCMLARGQHQLSSTGSSTDASAREALAAIKGFQVAPGLKVELWAAEPMVVNPVAFTFDEKGRAYVCETFRLGAGVDDIRRLMDWLDEELASRSVDDRLAEMKRHLGDRFRTYSEQSERIRLLEDRGGTGKADHATVFADGFNSPLDGIAAGVLPHKDSVWYANIPNLWLLTDTNHDGVADARKSLHYGFGVRVGFLGHDLHGLRFGPDGKIYFSIGDRGASIRLPNGASVGDPDSGCVFRCNPDGSELELFAFGLRNPQDLVFDEHGNLFTGDNNSDSGDEARWVYLVEGADNGWRVGYQFMESPYSRGPFNAEKLWYPPFKGQPAYIVPPVGSISSGPSGVACFPGTGLPERFDHHFFLVDFRGGGTDSGIHDFTLKPKGAGFQLTNPEHLIWGVLPTDVKFGVDGGIYFSDWVEGWGKPNKGRIYRIHDPAVDADPLVLETKQLLARGMDDRPLAELARLLAHADMRVRQEAQFELADRGLKSVKILERVAAKHAHALARLHAIWGLGQIMAKFRQPESEAELSGAIESLSLLLADKNEEVRAQAARVLGERRVSGALAGLVSLLKDDTARVRFFAAMALGKIGNREAIPALFEMLRDNNDRDPWLRHAGVMGLVWIGEVRPLIAAATDDSPAVRTAALLALRRLHRSEIATFLKDENSDVVVEAARAINDEPINGALADLAGLIEKPVGSEPLMRRVLNANSHLGTSDSAKALATFTARNEASESMRCEALEELAAWAHPSGRDRVVGLWRPVAATRSREVASDALQSAIATILDSAPVSVQLRAIRTAKALAMTNAAPLLLATLTSSKTASEVQVEALRALAGIDPSLLEQALTVARESQTEELRKAASLLELITHSSGSAVRLAQSLEHSSLDEKQAALAALGHLVDPAADEIVAQQLDRLQAGRLGKDVELDLLEAAAQRKAPAVQEKLAAYQASKSNDDPLAQFRETLFGGNAKKGKQVFERADAQCIRCHRVNRQGGDVGPDLSHVSGQKPREYLLESILVPNKQIAQGFESVTVTLKNDETYVGVLKKETPDEIVLNSQTGATTIMKADIVSRKAALSPMPEGLGQVLSKRDLRDLIEFLSSLK